MAIDMWKFLKGIVVQDTTDKTKTITLQAGSGSTTGTSTTITASQTANRTITMPDASTTIVGQDTSDALSNKTSVQVDNLTLDGNTLSSTNSNGDIVLDPNGTGGIDVSSARIKNVASPTIGSDAVNKTYSDTLVLGTQFTDDNFRVKDGSDVTKVFALELNGITTGTTKTWTVPNANSTFVGTDTAQDISNKTSITVDNLNLNGNTISSTDTDGNIILNPNGNGTVHVEDTLQLIASGTARLTLTGATLNSPSGAAGSAIYNETFASGDGRNIIIYTNSDSTNDSNKAGDIYLEGGNKSAGTGNGGSVILRSGTSAGGAAGQVLLDAQNGGAFISGAIIALNGLITITGSTTQTSQATFAEISTPANPASGYHSFYPKSDGNFYILDSNGNESVFGNPIGTILDYGGGTVPSGHLLCDGSAISRTTYAHLFAAISTTWGVGNGTTTFNVPDLRSRGTIGKDDMGGTPANRVTNAVSGITATTLGATGGDQNIHLHTHIQDAHKHRVLGNTGGPALVLGAETDNFLGAQGGGSYTDGFVGNAMETTVATNHNFGTGSSQNMPPIGVVNKIIKF